jgi:hypothetical protein
MQKLPLLTLALTALFLVSCSAEQKLKRRITGTWNISAYTEQNVNGDDGTTANVGTLTFFRNGRGEKSLTGIPWRVNVTEGNDFRWHNTANTVTILSENSIFAKSWIITINKKKRQEWKSTDRGNVQTIQLRR